MNRTLCPGSLILVALASCYLLPTAGCSSATPANEQAQDQGSAVSPAQTPSSRATSAAAGPASPGKQTQQAQSPTSSDPATGLLQRMVAVYRQAKTYSDAGELRLRYQAQEAVDRRVADFSVSFARPDRIRAKIYQTTFTQNGTQLAASIADLPNQVLKHDEAPTPISLKTIALQSELLRDLMRGSLEFPSPIMVLLLEDRPLPIIYQNLAGMLKLDPAVDVSSKALAPQIVGESQFDGHLCQRVSVAFKLEQGLSEPIVFWIDKSTGLLRRMELPVKPEPNTDGVDQLQLTADFLSASLKPVDPEVFETNTPADKAVVRRFVTIPPPVAPAEVLGKKLPEITLQDLQGQEVSTKSWLGKIVVVDLWATWCPYCLKGLPLVEQVRQEFAEDQGVLFVAVSLDKEDEPNKNLLAQFRQIKVDVPILRDHKGALSELVGAPPLPQRLLIDARGIVQDIEIGYDARLAEQLTQQINDVTSGENLHQIRRERYQQALNEYQQLLQAAALKDPPLPAGGTTGGLTSTAGQNRTQPKQLSLKLAWTQTDLLSPGNILVIPGSKDKPPAFLVVDAAEAVAEIDPSGQMKKRLELPLPDGVVCTNLRAARNVDGSLTFAALAPGQPQTFWLDSQFDLVTAYPTEVKPDLAISDAQLADLDGDRKPELLVSHYGTTGIHAVSPQGSLLWDQQKDLQDVFRIAVAGGAEGGNVLLAASSRGSLGVLDGQGQMQPALEIGPTARHPVRRFVEGVFSRDLTGDGRPELLALCREATGEQVAVGFDLQGEELWSYPLPPGQHEQVIEPVCGGRLAGLGSNVAASDDAASDDAAGVWVLACADGSLHLITADGRGLDSFNYGATLTGVGMAYLGENSLLLVSSVQPGPEPNSVVAALQAYHLRWPQGAEIPQAAEPRDSEAGKSNGPSLVFPSSD